MKNPAQKHLDRFRIVFFWSGLIIVLTLIIILFEWKSYAKKGLIGQDKTYTTEIIRENIPNTYSPKKEPPRSQNVKAGDPINPIDLTVIDLPKVDWIQSDLIGSGMDLDTVDWDGMFIEPIEVEVVSKKPIFPGCEEEITPDAQYACFQEKFVKFIKREFDYPQSALTFGESEKLYFSFVIDVNGKVQEVTKLRGNSEALVREAERVIEILPEMRPAVHNGRKVPVRFVVPIDLRTH